MMQSRPFEIGLDADERSCLAAVNIINQNGVWNTVDTFKDYAFDVDTVSFEEVTGFRIKPGTKHKFILVRLD